jgi:hypothetical protein
MSSNIPQRKFVNTDWSDLYPEQDATDGVLRVIYKVVLQSNEDKVIMKNYMKQYGIGDAERDEQYRNEGYEDYYDYLVREGDAETFPVIITQFGSWAVTTFGLECLVKSYSIDAAQLTSSHWIDHMSLKGWVNMTEFSQALYHGRKIHNFLQRTRRG